MQHFTRETTGIEVVKAFQEQVTGSTFVITGPSKDSLAAEAACCLAQSPSPPSHIILLGRSEIKIQPVIDRINELNSSINTSYIKLDLSDNKSVRTCAEQVQAVTSKIDVLINSAGIMALEEYSVSTDGYEMQLAACHIGHFLLTGLLLPQLQAAKAARVVTLTSMGYEASDFRFEDFNFSDGETYDRWAAYGQAKTANFMFTTELARRAAARGTAISAFVVHPGVVLSSGIIKAVSMEHLMKALEDTKAAYAAQGVEYVPEQPKTVEQGCSTMLVAALASELEGQSGSFLKDCQVVEVEQLKTWVKDQEKANKLWELSSGWVGEKFL